MPVRILGCAAALVAGCAVLTGCGGSATMNIVSLNATAIDPPDIRVRAFHADSCVHWVDEDGRLNLAMRHQGRGLLTKLGDLDFEVSLVLGGPPAGSGRDFPVGTNTVRGRWKSALEEHRLLSYGGIVSVLKKSDGRLQGSFRIFLRQYAGMSVLSLFPRRPSNLLLFGTFSSTEDPGRGGEIRALTESAGWERPAQKPAAANPVPPKTDPTSADVEEVTPEIASP